MSTFQFPTTAGATLLARSRTRFRFFAPGQENVSLVIEGGEPIAMERSEDGWFEIEAECGVGCRYRYGLKDGLLVPDPASRLQGPDVHDPSVVVDPQSFVWRCPDWSGRPWEEMVVYELHAGLLGGFAGVTEKLAALAEIGITAIELMPINDFPGRHNWGYDGVLPYAPDTAYGSPEDLKAMIDRAHELGMSVFLDVVYNHFGPDGNYLGSYFPQFFREDVHTPWGGAIDFRHPEVRRYFTENVLYWLMEYRFDGLRFDAVHAITESDWLHEVARTVRETVEPGRHVHLVLENEHNEVEFLAGAGEGAFDAQWNDDFHHCVHVMLTGEHHGYYGGFVEGTAEKLARSLAEGFVYQGETPPGGKPRGSKSAHLPPTAFVSCIQNHDQIGNRAMGERLSTLAGEEKVEAATSLLLLTPHIPLIFMGEETGSLAPFLFFTDHHDGLAQLVRDGRRKEFAAFPEFADEEKRKLIPDPNSIETFERSRPLVAGEGGDAGREDLYRTLLSLRRTRIVPYLAGARSMGAQAIGEKAIVARWRLSGSAVMTLACNLGDESVSPPAGAPFPTGEPLLCIGAEPTGGELGANSTILWIEDEA